jgi:hypothetical protein
MSVKPLGFEHQGNYEGSCGAYALGHALNLVGITGEIESIKNSANYISWVKSADKNFSLSGLLNPITTFKKISKDEGTTEKGILRGIKKSGCAPIHINNYSQSTSRKLLESHLKNGYPVILFANWGFDEGHWYVCAGKKSGKYIVIDSKPKLARKGTISLYTWDEIERRSIVYGEEKSYFQLFGFAVQPSDSVSAVPRLNECFYRLSKDESLRDWWGYYLNDLRKIFDATSDAKKVITSKNFFSKYGKSFLKNTKSLNYEFSPTGMSLKLYNYQIVADTYNLAITKSNLEGALIGFTAVLLTSTLVDSTY